MTYSCDHTPKNSPPISHNTMKISCLFALLLVPPLRPPEGFFSRRLLQIRCWLHLIDLFESWTLKQGKSYWSFKEKLHRFEIFKENIKCIDETNRQRTSYWLGLNEFADLRQEEFKQWYLGLRTELPRKREFSSGFSYADVVDLPKSVDWRRKGAVTHVKDKGQCDN